MKKLLLMLVAVGYVGVSHATEVRTEVTSTNVLTISFLDTFPWPMAARCSFSKDLLEGTWELESGEYLTIEHQMDFEGNDYAYVVKYDAYLEMTAMGWGAYDDDAGLLIDMYHLEDSGQTFTQHDKMLFGYFGEISNGRTCQTKTPFVYTIDVDILGIEKGEYLQMDSAEELSIFLR